jgi:hypothetical protein
MAGRRSQPASRAVERPQVGQAGDRREITRPCDVAVERSQIGEAGNSREIVHRHAVAVERLQPGQSGNRRKIVHLRGGAVDLNETGNARQSGEAITQCHRGTMSEVQSIRRTGQGHDRPHFSRFQQRQVPIPLTGQSTRSRDSARANVSDGIDRPATPPDHAFRGPRSRCSIRLPLRCVPGRWLSVERMCHGNIPNNCRGRIIPSGFREKLLGQSGWSTFDSVRARSTPTTEESDHKSKVCYV